MAFNGDIPGEDEVPTVLTVGHSSHTFEQFAALLRNAGITAVADVRAIPYSRQLPQFNRDALTEGLRHAGIAYSFLGKELGGRPADPRLYREGVADYESMAATEAFERGLDRVLDGARKYRIALMCSEKDPLDCHRCLLVGRALARRGAAVRHILASGEIMDQTRIEDDLLSLAGRTADDLFASREERLAIAYRERGRKVAFAEPEAAGSVVAE